METFTPEFAAFWNDADASEDRHGAENGSAEHGPSQSQQLALEELAERVNAARSVL